MHADDAKGPLEALKRLGAEVEDTPLWALALTHRSYAHESGAPAHESNERLEFLGDAVIELAISEYLYKRFPELPEGALAKMRASVVRTESLADIARRLSLGSVMRLGNGEEQSGGRTRPSLLADLFEAVVGAVYLSRGWAAARRFILKALTERLNALNDSGNLIDPKTVLQERLQAESKTPPTYRLVRDSGPAHRKRFESEVIHLGRVLGRGEGKSKKASEQAAAEQALKFLGPWDGR